VVARRRRRQHPQRHRHATAGIDPQELIDTRPYAREWHFHILNDRALYGLPRKFNVGFDGGGIIPVLEDTNDIGFQAVEVIDGHGIEPGVWFASRSAASPATATSRATPA
jgi:sulfite reductase beta subunit-like hemoprotein